MEKLTSNIKEHLIHCKELAIKDPQKAYQMAENLLKIAKDTSDKCLEAEAYYLMAYADRVMSEASKGLKNALKSLDYFKMYQCKKGCAKVENLIGIFYFYYGVYTDAMEYFMLALQNNSGRDLNLEASIYNNLGEVYREAEKFDEALKYYQKALTLSQKHDFLKNIAPIYVNIGEIAFLKQDYSEASHWWENAKILLEKEENVVHLSEIEVRLARIALVNKAYNEAENIIARAIHRLKAVNNGFYHVEALILMSEVLEAQNKCPIETLEGALEVALQFNLDYKVSLIHLKMADHFEGKCQYDKALNAYKNFHSKEKEIEASNLSRRLELLSIEIDPAKRLRVPLEYNRIYDRLKKDMSKSQKELERIKRHNRTLLIENQIDALTGLYNRRGIDENFRVLFKENPSFTGVVYLLDIDYFKKFNDQYGHQEGDQCLKQIATFLKSRESSQSFWGRYGGEEFIGCHAFLTEEEALDFANQLRMRIQNDFVMYDLNKNSISTEVTVSIGGAFGQINPTSLNQTIYQADLALYKAKNNGRNQVLVEKLDLSNQGAR